MATYERAVAQSAPSAPSNEPGMPVFQLPAILFEGKAYPVILTNSLMGTLPVRKGGTGITELEGGKLLASNAKGQALEEIDVDVQKFSGLTGNIQQQFNKVRRYSLNVPTTGWTRNADGSYTQSFQIPGMTSSDNPIIGLIPSATTADALNAEKLSYECLDDAVTENGRIILSCYTSIPTQAFSISINCTGN